MKLPRFASGLLVAVPLFAQSPPTREECLDALARTAATFAATAPGLMARETFDQRGRRGFFDVLKGKKDETKDLEIKLPQEFRVHQVISNYGLAEMGDAHVLHEIRTIVTIDGRDVTDASEARHALTIGLQSADDRTKRKLLENLEHRQLEGAVTDFGQLILLFTKRHQNDYDFVAAGQQLLGDEPAAVFEYRQVSGAQGLTIFKERTQTRQPTHGQIWFRLRDLLPLRITLNTVEVVSKKFTIRTEATVHYIPSRFGLVPDRVTHKQYLNSDLMVENDLRYADFHHANAMIP
jgi:hypothetical protein